MTQMSGWIRYSDGTERPDVAITWGTLKALMRDAPDDTLIRVNPITRNLMLSTFQYLDLAEETLVSA